MLIGRPVTVLGGGIGGLAAALACAQRGAKVTVIERAADLGEVGAGIQVSPNGWRVLAALGLARDLAARSPRAEAVRLRDFRAGRDVFRVPLTDPDQPYHFVHRADLVDVLAKAVKAAGVALRLGAEVTGLTFDGRGTHLTYGDGRHETRGLTIAADGLHSVARPLLNPRSRPYFTGQVAWRATVPWDGARAPEAQVFMGPGRHLVRYPLRSGRLMNIVAVEERDGWAAEGWHHRDDPDHLRRAFTDFCPEVHDLLARVETVFLWGLFRHPVAETWGAAEGQGAVALLGDAAHPTLPFMAQGANMALEDGYILAQCLAEETDTTQAIARYQGVRRSRVMRVVQAAEENATNYHLRPGPARAAAHAALRLAGRMAPHLVTRRFDWVYRYDPTRAV